MILYHPPGETAMNTLNMHPQWTQTQALVVAHEFELMVLPHNGHIALGGSCLHKGFSTKDLDLFLYAHKPPFTEDQLNAIFNALPAYGITIIRSPNNAVDDLGEPLYWRKVAQLQDSDHRRIDLFILNG